MMPPSLLLGRSLSTQLSTMSGMANEAAGRKRASAAGVATRNPARRGELVPRTAAHRSTEGDNNAVRRRRYELLRLGGLRGCDHGRGRVPRRPLGLGGILNDDIVVVGGRGDPRRHHDLGLGASDPGLGHRPRASGCWSATRRPGGSASSSSPSTRCCRSWFPRRRCGRSCSSSSTS